MHYQSNRKEEKETKQTNKNLGLEFTALQNVYGVNEISLIGSQSEHLVPSYWGYFGKLWMLWEMRPSWRISITGCVPLRVILSPQSTVPLFFLLSARIGISPRHVPPNTTYPDSPVSLFLMLSTSG